MLLKDLYNKRLRQVLELKECLNYGHEALCVSVSDDSKGFLCVRCNTTWIEKNPLDKRAA